jgi:thiol-disulfide isomerase/thioredoxin
VSLTLPSDDGRLATLPVKRARATVIDFFAPSCGPCEKKVPALAAKRSELTAKGAVLIFVAVLGDSESTDDARRALERWGAPAPFLVDTASVSRREAGVHELPATLVLDHDGVVRWVAPLHATADDVVAAVP